MNKEMSIIEKLKMLYQQKGSKLDEEDLKELTREVCASVEEYNQEWKEESDRLIAAATLRTKEAFDKRAQEKRRSIEQLKQLFLEYNLSLQEEHLEHFFSLLTKVSFDVKNPKISNSLIRDLKKVELVKFLYLCSQNQYPVTISINVKSQKKSITINDQYLILHLWYLVNTLIDEDRGEAYEQDLTINRREKIRDYYEDDPEYWNQYARAHDMIQSVKSIRQPSTWTKYHQPYCNYELQLIHEYETDVLEKNIKISKHHISNVISKAIKYFRNEGVFKKGFKTIGTDEACFLYDSLVMIGLLQSDGIEAKTEKYDYIKRRIKA